MNSPEVKGGTRNHDVRFIAFYAELPKATTIAAWRLPLATIGDMTVELAQADGPLKAGEKGQLVIKLPCSDNGVTVIRAWIGGEYRTLSFVRKGAYAPSNDDYDVHAMVPDPLPESTTWWIEIEKPDGTNVVGSVQPKTECGATPSPGTGARISGTSAARPGVSPPHSGNHFRFLTFIRTRNGQNVAACRLLETLRSELSLDGHQAHEMA